MSEKRTNKKLDNYLSTILEVDTNTQTDKTDKKIKNKIHGTSRSKSSHV